MLKTSDLQKLKSAAKSKSKNESGSAGSELKLSQAEEPTGTVIESVLVKGVFGDRSLNNRSDAYLLMDNQEALGLKYYIHKSSKGINDYNLEDTYLSSFNDDTIVGDLNEEKIKLVKTRDNKLVLRVYYQISDSSRLILLDAKNKDLLNPDKNTNNNVNSNNVDNRLRNNKHFLIFDNELKSSSSFALLNKDFESWLASHDVDMNCWKLVDVDNFMKGNSFFNNKTALEAQLTAGINSIGELGAALNGYFHEENYESLKESVETEAQVNNSSSEAASASAEKDKSKKDQVAASNKEKEKEKTKKEAKESKAKDKDAAKGKKADKGDKAEKAEEKPAAVQQQLLTQLDCSYKVNYLFDLKDSQEMNKYAEDAGKIGELILSEISKIRKGQAAQKKDAFELEKKTQEKSQVFFERLMEFIETVINQLFNY